MRTLYFTQITDDRFDKNIRQLLQERTEKIKALLNIDGVEVIVSDIRELHFDGYKYYREDGSISCKQPSSNQCRCRFQIRKTTKKLSWEDIYKIVNSVKPARYSFTGFLS